MYAELRQLLLDGLADENNWSAFARHQVSSEERYECFASFCERASSLRERLGKEWQWHQQQPEPEHPLQQTNDLDESFSEGADSEEENEGDYSLHDTSGNDNGADDTDDTDVADDDDDGKDNGRQSIFNEMESDGGARKLGALLDALDQSDMPKARKKKIFLRNTTSAFLSALSHPHMPIL